MNLKRRKAPLALFPSLAFGLMFFLCVSACGGDTTPPEGTDDTGPIDTIEEVSPEITDDAAVAPDVPAATDTGVEDVSAAVDAAAPEDTESPAPVSACTNPIDLTIITDSGNQVQADAGAFGQSCMGSDDIAQCTADKLIAKYGLTEGCSSCFAEVLACLVEECLLKCGADPASNDCKCCKQDKGCDPDFYACSGLPEEPSIDCGE